MAGQFHHQTAATWGRQRQESIVGGTGVSMEDFTGAGLVWLEGESWQAKSSVPIRNDQEVLVTALVGLVLHVEPIPEATAIEAELKS